jgi:hypothetical protein
MNTVITARTAWCGEVKEQEVGGRKQKTILFRLAVNNGQKDEKGNNKADYILCKIVGDKAETFHKFCGNYNIADGKKKIVSRHLALQGSLGFFETMKKVDIETEFELEGQIVSATIPVEVPVQTAIVNVYNFEFLDPNPENNKNKTEVKSTSKTPVKVQALNKDKVANVIKDSRTEQPVSYTPEFESEVVPF